MFRFLHAADFHLDSAFHALSPQRAAERRRESRELGKRLAEEALRRGADLMLLSGDLFDGTDSFHETPEELAEGLGRVGVSVFIAPGNHDFYGPDSPYAAVEWPENVYIFKSGRMESVDLPDFNCTVHGAAFTGPEQVSGLLTGFTAPEDGRVHLMTLHGDVEPSAARYNPIARAEIAASGLNYLALGHIHAASGPQRCGKTLWAYPGCTEGRGFDELGDKGFYFGTVSDEGTVTLEFVPFARHRYEILNVDITDKDPREALEAALPAWTTDDLYRVLLTGETDERGIDLTALNTLFSGRFYALELRDRTRVRQDVWARADEDSLRGEFLRRLRKRYDAAADDKERENVTRAVRFGLAALDHRDIL
jgi:DNA repair exonuclease SbcCD nuclease subunit